MSRDNTQEKKEVDPDLMARIKQRLSKLQDKLAADAVARRFRELVEEDDGDHE